MCEIRVAIGADVGQFAERRSSSAERAVKMQGEERGNRKRKIVQCCRVMSLEENMMQLQSTAEDEIATVKNKIKIAAQHYSPSN